MSSSMIEFIVLAGIALFVGWRLFVTLGQDQGPPEGHNRMPTPGPTPTPAANTSGSGDVVQLRPSFTGPGGAGMEAIYEVDNSFDPRTFMHGARSAYEMIVGAFGRGDRTALKPLLDTDVYEAWDAAIAEREATGSEGLQLLRVRKAEITDASLGEDGMARVTVLYESELGDGETTAKAAELWTYMRQTKSDDPNWLLDDVDTAD